MQGASNTECAPHVKGKPEAFPPFWRLRPPPWCGGRGSAMIGLAVGGGACCEETVDTLENDVSNCPTACDGWLAFSVSVSESVREPSVSSSELL